MTDPRLLHVQCLDARGLHRMAYWEWGDPHNPRVVICVHGLTRQGRDFDTLARALCDEFRVVCPDVVGRGESDWLADPAGYVVPTYLADMVTLLARLHAAQVHWVGTSMGGLIGMALGGLRGSPLQRLVLNDVGPVLDFAALQRIGTYVGQAERFETVEAATDYLSSISAGFGPLTRAQWLELSRPQLRPEADGRLRMHYDPSIRLAFNSLTPESAALGEAALWTMYDAIACPTLLLRGAESDLLSRATADAMMQRGPRPALIEFAGVGHAPMLLAEDQVSAVKAFLSEPQAE